MGTRDLFETLPLPGLAYAEALIDEQQESRLINAIDESHLSSFRFQGWLGKRQTATFGWQYDFDDASFTPGPPMPGWLSDLRIPAAAAVGLLADELVHVLIIRYDPGAGIGWHRDRGTFEHVVGISLGNPAVMRFRRRRKDGFDRVSVPLAPRSVYRLSGDARHEWEHSIAPMDVPRWSITFRTLSDKGRAIAERFRPPS